MARTFTINWKRSTQPRKQRKFRYQAPLHVKQKMLHSHLSSELRAKHGVRNTQVRKGDKVKVLRGKFAKKEGKVEHVSVKQERVYVTGLEVVKRDGSKVTVPLQASNLLITSLDLSDKKRKQKLSEEKGGSSKKSTSKKSNESLAKSKETNTDKGETSQ